MSQRKSIDGLIIRETARKSDDINSQMLSHTKKNSPKSTPKPAKTQVKKSSSTPQKVSRKNLKKPSLSPKKVSPKTAEETSSLSREKIISDFVSPVTVFNFDGEQLTASKNEKNMQKNSENEAKIEEKSSKKASKSKKSLRTVEKSPKSHKKRNIIASIILIIVLLLGAGILWLCLWGSDLLAKITGDGNLTDLMSVITQDYEPLKEDENGRTNILAFGTSGYDMSGSEGDGTHDGAQLTDSIMVISFDQDSGDVAMLSLPRDLKVDGSCTWSGKINEVYYVCGENAYPDDEKTAESAGAEALMETVSDVTGLDLQYYAHVNWESLIEIVNALGGITVTLDEDVNDYYYTGAVYKAGVEYTLNGEQALGLARARHGTENGDFSRGESQQKILIGIKNKVIDEGLSMSEMLSFANTMGDNLRTNLSAAELATSAHLASTLNFDSMRTISFTPGSDDVNYFTTANIGGISYVIPAAGASNYSALQKYIASEIENDPAAAENAEIAVLNATNISGLAAEAVRNLEKDTNLTVSLTDNAPDLSYPDQQYIIYDISGSTPLSLEKLENYYGLTAETSSTLADLYSSYDIIIVVNGIE